MSRPTLIGGFGLSSAEIAIILGMRSLASVLIPVPLYSLLGPHLGPQLCSKMGSFLMPLIYLLYFALARIVKQGLDHTHTFAAIGGIQVFGLLSQLAYMSVAQMVASRAPTRAYLSRANTAAEFVANAGHGLGTF